MKKILITGLLFAVFVLELPGGTLIYKDADGASKVVSEVTIVSINRNIITLKIGKGTKFITQNQMLRYYDTDVNLNLAFDDNTADYNVRLGTFTIPPKGISIEKKKKVTTEIAVQYYVERRPGSNQQRDSVKVPYFYLFVITTGPNGDTGRDFFVYSYPKEAKTRMKSYDEALMMEKAISAERPTSTFEQGRMSESGNRSGNLTARFKLDGIGDREIIACYLVVWGKDDIVLTKEEKKNSSYKLSDRWYLTNNQ